MERRFTVAGETGCRRIYVTATRMTLETGRIPMRSSQWEAGKVMVECHLRPAIGGMAGAAVVPELTPMLVIFLVASHTLGRRADKLPPLVTAVAGELYVGARKREIGLSMIEGEIDPC